MERQIPSAANEQLTSPAQMRPQTQLEDLSHPVDHIEVNQSPDHIEQAPPTNEIVHRHTSFESAQRVARPLSDALIHASITHEPIRVKDTALGVRGYLESTLVDASDVDIIDDPNRIGAIHTATALVVANRLAVRYPQHRPELAMEAEAAKRAYTDTLALTASRSGRELSDWCTLRGDFPANSMTFAGCNVQGQDILDANTPRGECVANLSVKRTPEGTMIRGLSQVEHERTFNGTTARLNRTIVVNPRLDATPEVFEALLMVADQLGVAAQIDMIDRASECAAKYYAKHKGSYVETIRGNAIDAHSGIRRQPYA
jgi:hypothetical protein